MNKPNQLSFRLTHRLKKVYHSFYFAPSVVCVAMLFITYWSWRASIDTVNRDTISAAVDHSGQVQNDLVQRLSSYEQILTGGAGLFRGSQEVSQSEWHDYVRTFDIAKRYPGVQGIGYAKAFNADQLPSVVSAMQAQGIDFHISPDTPRDFYTAILYFDPPGTTNPSGIDLFAEPNRMKTMSRARNTGLTSITPPLKSLLPDTDQLVLYIFVPQYQKGIPLDTVPERQQALQGYVYARLKSQDFFKTLLNIDAGNNSKALQLAANDGVGQWQALYKTPNYDRLNNTHGYVKEEQIINIYGQIWKLNYSYKISDLLPAQRRSTPAWTLFAGLMLSLLLAEVVYLLLKARANELSNLKEEAVDLAKDELLSLASHQLRTPATTVKQYLGMVLQGFAGDTTPTQTSLLNKAYAGNERQLYIINEMLHVAKIDAGRIVLARHPTNINQLLQDIVQEASNEVAASNHKLNIKLPKKPLNLNIDEHMMRMAMENIISNAIKYTLPGGKITVSLQKSSGQALVKVQDTGIGIDQNDMNKLYKLFTRLDNPLTQNVGGTGVGLYLAKHLIELHGGSIHVSSAPKKGSTFTISLPLTT